MEATANTTRRPRLRHRAARTAIACACAAATLGLLCAGVAVAQDDANPPPRGPSGYARPGIYLAVAGGALIKTFDLPDGITDQIGESAYIGGKIGSRHNRWIATETSVDYGLKAFELDDSNDFIPGVPVEMNPLYVSGNVKLYALDGRWQPWVAGGIGGAWAFFEARVAGSTVNVTRGSFLGRVGGGLDFYINRSIVIGPELYWNATTGDLQDLRTLSIGANVYFRF